VIGQAAGFAVLAAVSPTSLLVMAVFLGSANPRTTALLYVAGAMLMTVVMAVVVLLVLRATGLNHPREHDPRYGFRLGLGFICLIIAVFVARRARRATVTAPVPAATTPAAGWPAAGTAPVGTAAAGMSAAGTATPDTAAAGTTGPGFVSRLVASPKPSAAFVVGVILFAPSATFIAAVQVIATANASAATTALALVIVVILTGLIVWLPLLTYLAAPDATTRRLKALNGWLRANGRVLLMSALTVCGLALIVSSSVSLAGG
jgi:Sap, sulfolipid-1-addressing protein